VPETADISQVPARDEATPGDDVSTPDAKCTPGSGEGAEPVFGEVIPNIFMYHNHSQIEIFALYGVGAEDGERKNSVPFVQHMQLGGPQGEVVRTPGVVDDGALVAALDSKFYETVKHRLAGLGRSARILRMADTRLTPSTGTWTGDVTLGGKTYRGCFEVFDSRCTWTLLFGKPLLEKFDAVHEYCADILHLRDSNGWISLQNLFPTTHRMASPILALTSDTEPQPKPRAGRNARRREARIWVTAIANQEERARDINWGEDTPPARQVPAENPLFTLEKVDDSESMQGKNPIISPTARKTVRFAGVESRGEGTPPTRRVSASIIPEHEKQHDQPPIFQPVLGRPLTSFGVERKSAEERAE
jgi:hypothetical protein